MEKHSNWEWGGNMLNNPQVNHLVFHIEFILHTHQMLFQL